MLFPSPLKTYLTQFQWTPFGLELELFGVILFFWLLSFSFYVKGPFLNLRGAHASIASKNVITDQCYVKELYSFILQPINTLRGLTLPLNMTQYQT